MLTNPHAVTREFERALCEYAGAPFAVAVNSCTMALLLAVRWHVDLAQAGIIMSKHINLTNINFGAGGGITWSEDFDRLDGIERMRIEIPKRTYVSVPMSIIHAGAKPTFRDEDWKGWYDLRPLPVVDSARWLTSGMYKACKGQFVCLSFHSSKTLGDTQGGAILHDTALADPWLRRMRFDGRTEGVAPKDDSFNDIGYHCYISPDVSARLLWKLRSLPLHNEPLPNDDYPDLSLHPAFR